jgi:hypothetical protein
MFQISVKFARNLSNFFSEFCQKMIEFGQKKPVNFVKNCQNLSKNGQILSKTVRFFTNICQIFFV